MRSARWRLESLWLAQVARSLADGCLGLVLVRQLLGNPARPAPALPWWFVVPALLAALACLTPCAVALSQGLPRRWTLAAPSVLALSAVVLWATLPDLPFWSLGLLATGAVLHALRRDALLAAAARDARLSLNRVVSGMGTGSAAAVAAGLLLGDWLARLPEPERWPTAVAVLVALNLLALLATPFAAEKDRRADPAAAPTGSFLRAGRRLFADTETRDVLLASAGFVALFLVGCGAASGPILSQGRPLFERGSLAVLCWLALGAAAGSALAAVLWHPYRALCLVPVAVTGLCGALLWTAASSKPTCPGLCFLIGAMGGLGGVPLRTAFLFQVPAGAHACAVTWRNLVAAGLAALAGGLLFALPGLHLTTGSDARFGLLVLMALLTVPAAWWAFFREVAEYVAELLIAPSYRVRVHGPGVDEFPIHGPLLVLANHASWFDPLWLCKMLPRRVTPLMISVYYDKPILHWLMSRVVRAIRVQDSPYRREAPELHEAVAVLDRGGCVLIFPEGVVRRKQEQLLRPFGQGIWRILSERPETPVVACWIEGAWGSFTSFYQGPPMTNKPLDRRRPIDIAISPPRVVDASILADRQATRHHLMWVCLDARHYLGLAESAAQAIAEESVAGRKD